MGRWKNRLFGNDKLVRVMKRNGLGDITLVIRLQTAQKILLPICTVIPSLGLAKTRQVDKRE